MRCEKRAQRLIGWGNFFCGQGLCQEVVG